MFSTTNIDECLIDKFNVNRSILTDKSKQESYY